MTTLPEALGEGCGEYPTSIAVDLWPDMKPGDALSELQKYAGPNAKRGLAAFRVIEHIATHGGARILIAWAEQFLGQPVDRQRRAAEELEQLIEAARMTLEQAQKDLT